jgi:hypothetical protein
MFLFFSFEQNVKQKKNPNGFRVDKTNENVTHILLTKGCVVWWQRHWDASMRSSVETHANQIYECHIFGHVYGLLVYHTPMVVGR